MKSSCPALMFLLPQPARIQGRASTHGPAWMCSRGRPRRAQRMGQRQTGTVPLARWPGSSLWSRCGVLSHAMPSSTCAAWLNPHRAECRVEDRPDKSCADVFPLSKYCVWSVTIRWHLLSPRCSLLFAAMYCFTCCQADPSSDVVQSKRQTTLVLSSFLFEQVWLLSAAMCCCCALPGVKPVSCPCSGQAQPSLHAPCEASVMSMFRTSAAITACPICTALLP